MYTVVDICYVNGRGPPFFFCGHDVEAVNIPNVNEAPFLQDNPLETLKIYTRARKGKSRRTYAGLYTPYSGKRKMKLYCRYAGQSFENTFSAFYAVDCTLRGFK